MHRFPQRVKDAILPLSEAETLPEAFEEWSFTGNTFDHGESLELCRLCQREESRYSFEIGNSLTRRTLWVGSRCILTYGIAVSENGVCLTKPQARKKLTRLIREMRIESCLNTLEKLAAGGNIYVRDAVEYFRTHRYLTPRFAFVFFWKLRQHEIDYSPSFFKVKTGKARYKRDLREMETGRVHFFWDALTKSQKKLAVSLGHIPPDKRIP